MAIKLYIFESVEDAAKFERGPAEVKGTVGSLMEFPVFTSEKVPGIEREREREREQSARAKAKRTPKADKEKQAVISRLVEKAKALKGKKPKGLRYCKKCGEPGHRSDNCPNLAPVKEDPDFGTKFDE